MCPNLLQSHRLRCWSIPFDYARWLERYHSTQPMPERISGSLLKAPRKFLCQASAFQLVCHCSRKHQYLFVSCPSSTVFLTCKGYVSSLSLCLKIGLSFVWCSVFAGPQNISYRGMDGWTLSGSRGCFLSFCFGHCASRRSLF